MYHILSDYIGWGILTKGFGRSQYLRYGTVPFIRTWGCYGGMDNLSDSGLAALDRASSIHKIIRKIAPKRCDLFVAIMNETSNGGQIELR